MSIASQIQRLQNAKTSIKTSIENKGIEVPNNALIDTYSTYIDNISGGLEIQNGVKVNYKATSGIVPAGTFIKLNTLYNNSDVRTLVGEDTSTSYYQKYVNNLIHLTNNIYVFINGKDELCSVIATDNGFEKYVDPKPLPRNVVSGYMHLIRLSDTLLFFASGNTLTGYILKFENGILTTEVSNIALTISGSSLLTFNLFEDTDYWYLHGSNRQYLKCFKISKNDYTINASSNVSWGDYSGAEFICPQCWLVDNEKVLTVNYGSCYLYNYDKTTNSYGNYILEENKLGFGSWDTPYWYFKFNNRYFAIGSKYIDNVNHRILMEFNVNSSNQLIQIKSTDLGVILSSEPSNYTYNIINVINNNYAIWIYSDTSTSPYTIKYRIIKYGTDLIFGNEGTLTTLVGTNPSSSDGLMAYPYNIVKQLTNKLLIICGYTIGLYTIDENALLLQDETGTSISVSEATNVIMGLATSECTPNVAGDVYLLDTTI